MLNSVGQTFFATMRIPLLYGRSFDFRDTPTSPKVAIINQALARKEFVGMNPVGKTFKTEEEETGTKSSVSVRTQSMRTCETIRLQPFMFCTSNRKTPATA